MANKKRLQRFRRVLSRTTYFPAELHLHNDAFSTRRLKHSETDVQRIL